MSKPKLTPVETTITEPIVGVDLTKLTPEEQGKAMMYYSCQDYPAKNYKIVFKEQEEQKIFKEFEALGYEILINPNNDDLIQIASEEYETIIEINKRGKWYESRTYGVNIPQSITSEEHQLLHKLFKIWGWFDE